MILLRFLTALFALGAISSTVFSGTAPLDCGRAEGAVEEAICGDRRLIMLEREVERLFGLAESGYRTKAREGVLAQSGREYRMARGTCEKAPEPLPCIADIAMARIGEIRAEYYEARQDDARGLSAGPVQWKCEGLGANVTAVSAATVPPLLHLAWSKETLTLESVPPASPEAQEAAFTASSYRFRIRQDAAFFAMPGRPEMACVSEPMG